MLWMSLSFFAYYKRVNSEKLGRTSDEWRQPWECKKSNRFIEQNVHFFPVTARLWHENVYFHILWKMKTINDKVFFLFLNFSPVPKKSMGTCLHLTFVIFSEFEWTRQSLKKHKFILTVTFLLTCIAITDAKAP